MCMIEAATGKVPFAFLSDDDVRDSVRKGNILAQPEEMNDDAWEPTSVTTTGSRFCSQRGTQVGDNTPPDTAPDDSYSTESARSPPSRPDPQESLEISDDDDDDAKSGDIPIPVLLDSIQGGNNANCEQALFRLLQLCIDEDPRKNLCDLNGVPVLVDAVKTCYSYFG
ncbi:hypothetical protein F442_21641 [Phytophthora nicotianae P10297]|uniref:Uncharacterized protein n=4 Tax=Phytophthora nicotianae TaxID=4792 RepID=W2QV34_PHYN3|nr:hypothetical protein PPTG_06489 [Phytophthora nicotianae INRA-310]ETK71598.1 hypothetical protein L915_21176 [Phytophthora nicotianae]ETO59920.1 hypothetical protein F444_21805 [Phytophthora nicotianae P1976]ETP29155.1 hypothetical protein F442_21641 [Phytophthora nicotianae P10297]ETL78252.1 hypothetical protein L917_20904 [Phytophthora nicotianae]ETM31516.1 hypothetical protein L914_20918 [Phytophthora nicotianae]